MRRRDNLSRRVVQYGNLVIDGFEMLSSQSLSKNVKESTTNRQFNHGSHFAKSAENHLYDSQRLGVTLNFDTRKLRKEDIKFYKQHVFLELSKPARVWAVEGRQLLHAQAFTSSITETLQGEPDRFSFNLDLVIVDGVWNMARQREVFLTEYDPCDFMNCLDLREEEPCLDCCLCIKSDPDHCGCMCECDVFIRENSLCELGREVLQEFYFGCTSSYKIHFNCQRGRVFDLDEESHGTICKVDACDRLVTGVFRTETTLTTNQVTIVAEGQMVDPTFKIGDRQVQVLGEFEGKLTIMPNWDVYYCPTDCCLEELLPFDRIVFEKGLGFEVSHGVHGFRGDMGTCCGMVCVHIFVDEITV